MTTEPAHIRLDRYALAQLAREHHLSAPACWALVALVCMADWRARTFTGELADLADFTQMSRNTVPKALAMLEQAEIIAIAVPFTRNRLGKVVITAWERLIVVGKPNPHAQNRAQPSGVNAHPARTPRAVYAQNHATDQPKDGSLRHQGREGNGSRSRTAEEQAVATATEVFSTRNTRPAVDDLGPPTEQPISALGAETCGQGHLIDEKGECPCYDPF